MQSDGGQGFLLWIVIVVVLVLVFLICREIVCWYWKINEGVDLLRQIRDRLPAPTPGQASGVSIAPAQLATPTQPVGPVVASGKRPCPHCGKEIRNDAQRCIHCDKDVQDLTKG